MDKAVYEDQILLLGNVGVAEERPGEGALVIITAAELGLSQVSYGGFSHYNHRRDTVTLYGLDYIWAARKSVRLSRSWARRTRLRRL